MCATCVPGTCEFRRELDPLELELGIFVSHCLGSGSQSHVLCKSYKCSKLLSHLSSPSLNFLMSQHTQTFHLKNSLPCYVLSKNHQINILTDIIYFVFSV